ncbi:universal stress protein [Haloarchaeobius sp. HRN-SO-5]|uniref:universal stress protein n=1 Tax=Haloarchaeobius sp. HRN-SO-5 TaxID=3446118 RepID=UPI003EBF552F
MYEHVLFPTDGSDATRRALRHALDIADTYGATLHVLSVVSEDAYRTEEGDEAATETANRTVETVARLAGDDDVDVTTEVRHGVPQEEILDYADEHDVDMIVMGTHGRTGVGRTLVGSVTERVVRRATVPVVTVRMTDEPTIRDAEEAERLALEELAERGHENVHVAEEPYRTSGSWIVPVEGDDVVAHVHIDAVSGTAHVARLKSFE